MFTVSQLNFFFYVFWTFKLNVCFNFSFKWYRLTPRGSFLDICLLHLTEVGFLWSVLWLGRRDSHFTWLAGQLVFYGSKLKATVSGKLEVKKALRFVTIQCLKRLRNCGIVKTSCSSWLVVSEPVYLCFKSKFFFFNFLFFVFVNCFDVMMLNINFLKKYYFDVFPNKKHFKKTVVL
jgi:hypothetical protein